MVKRLITIDEGVKILSKLGRERIGTNALDLSRAQLQAILLSFTDREASLNILGRSLRRLGEWLRAVNKNGQFNLPLRAIERELIGEVSALCEMDLSSLESSVSGYRVRHNSKSDTHVFIRRRAHRVQQSSQAPAGQSLPLHSPQGGATRLREVSC